MESYKKKMEQVLVKLEDIKLFILVIIVLKFEEGNVVLFVDGKIVFRRDFKIMGVIGGEE